MTRPPGTWTGGGLGQHHLGVGLTQPLHRLEVQVVPVLVGDENQVRLGELAVIGILRHRVHMDDLAPEGEHQGAVADKGDLKIPRPGLDDIRLKFLLSVHHAGPHHQQHNHHQS